MKKDELQDRLKAIKHWDNQYDHSAREIRGSRAAKSVDWKKRRQARLGHPDIPTTYRGRPVTKGKVMKASEHRRAKLKAGGKGTRAPITVSTQSARQHLIHGGTHGVYNPERDHRMQVRGLYK